MDWLRDSGRTDLESRGVRVWGRGFGAWQQGAWVSGFRCLGDEGCSKSIARVRTVPDLAPVAKHIYFATGSFVVVNTECCYMHVWCQCFGFVFGKQLVS